MDSVYGKFRVSRISEREVLLMESGRLPTLIIPPLALGLPAV